MSLTVCNQELDCDCSRYLVQESEKLKSSNGDLTLKLEGICVRHTCFLHDGANLAELNALLNQLLATNRLSLKRIILYSCLIRSSTYYREASCVFDSFAFDLAVLNALEYLAFDSISLASDEPLTEACPAISQHLKYLSLARLNLDRFQFSQIMTSLWQLSSLQVFHVSQDVIIDDSVLELLMKSLLSFNSLKELFIRRHLQVSSAALPAITSFLPHNKSLQFFDLLGNQNLLDVRHGNRETRLDFLLDFAKAVGQHPRLQTLVLRNCGMDEDGAQLYFQTTKKERNQFTLKHIDLTMNKSHRPLSWMRDVAQLNGLNQVVIPLTWGRARTIHSHDRLYANAIRQNISIVYIFDAWQSGNHHRRALTTTHAGTLPASLGLADAKVGPKLQHLLRRNQLLAHIIKPRRTRCCG
mmetsp:Transcript_20632/g.26604  ORF Transcript_20632/g.26604 Transcript_20632/m.26604 type:complete len:412 (-) Transcript_20632:287-1522(-)